MVLVGRRPYTEGLNLEAIGVEKDNKGRIIIDDQFSTSVKNIKCIGDVTFVPMLAHKAEEEGIAAVEYLKSGHGHVNYNSIPSVIYTHPEVAWVGQTKQDLKAAGIQYNIGKFPFAANSRAKTNLDSEGFVKFLLEKETDRILSIHIIGEFSLSCFSRRRVFNRSKGPNAGEMISEAVLALEYSTSSEDITRTTHAHVCFCFIRCMQYIDVSYSLAHTQRGIQGGCHVGIWKANSLLDEVIFYHCFFPSHAMYWNAFVRQSFHFALMYRRGDSNAERLSCTRVTGKRTH